MVTAVFLVGTRKGYETPKEVLPFISANFGMASAGSFVCAGKFQDVSRTTSSPSSYPQGTWC